jgi:hypothetical protein
MTPPKLSARRLALSVNRVAALRPAHWRIPGQIHLIWPLLACVAGWWFIVLRLYAPLQWDAQFTYLPTARAFLKHGWAFLLTPASCRVAPLGYLWPALWGADPAWIRVANMALWAGCVGFLWRASCLLGGRRAGVVALLLWLLSGLLQYFPSEMTEPVYLFGVLGLIHALARLVIARDRTPGAVAQGAAMLTVTLLSRPMLELIAPVALLGCLAVLALRAIRKRPQSAPGDWPAVLPRIALSLGLGLLPALAMMVTNGLTSGFWGLRTGAGVSLYLGTHPLFQGTEPAFLGFTSDVNALIAHVTGNPDVLSLAAEPVTQAAALWQIQNMSAADAITFFGRKLWWWLAHHPAEIQRTGSPIRPLRLFALSTLAVAALWAGWGWRRPRGAATAARAYAVTLVKGPTPGQWAFAALLLTMFVLLVGQLMPVLHNSRYSSAALEPWLIPLAAFCVAMMTGPIRLGRGTQDSRSGGEAAFQNGMENRMIWAAAASLMVIAIMTSVTYNLARRLEHVVVDPRHMGQVVTHLSITELAQIDTEGMAWQGQRQWTITQSPAVFMAYLDQPDVDRIAKLNPFNALWDTEIALRSTGQQPCRKAEVAYRTATGAILQPAYQLPLILPLHVDGQFHHLVTHANDQLRPREAGSLRIVLHCPVGTLVQWRQTRLLESRHALDAAAHVAP